MLADWDQNMSKIDGVKMSTSHRAEVLLTFLLVVEAFVVLEVISIGFALV